jgi:hypothetical protein
MTKLHPYRFTVKSFVKYRIFLLLAVVAALFLPPVLSTGEASLKKRQKFSSVAPPIIVRVPARALLDDEIEAECQPGEHKCTGSNCVNQCLKCIGGTWTATGPCSAQCCNEGGCVTGTCTPR